MASEIDLELYKSLRSEASGYVEKVPGLWIQKLLLVGGIIAFLVTEPLTNVSGSEHVLALCAVGALPVVAMLLDAKMFEYTLHARAISRFIASRFADEANVAAWETALWGDDSNQEVVVLTRIRSIFTWLTTVIPTVVILAGAGLVIERIVDNGAGTFVPFIVLGTLYFAATAWGAMVVYRMDSGLRPRSTPS